MESDFLKILKSEFKSIEVDQTTTPVSIIADSKTLTPILKFLKTDERFLCKILIDLFGVDYPSHEARFEVNYNLLSISHNHRLNIKIKLKDGQSPPSITKLFSNAAWYEREVWDMYGIKFIGNNDMRRILTDYEFNGHPLRKDFPLTGYVEVRYDKEKQKVIYEPVKLTQEYRRFDFTSPWEGYGDKD